MQQTESVLCKMAVDGDQAMSDGKWTVHRDFTAVDRLCGQQLVDSTGNTNDITPVIILHKYM